MVPYLVPCDHAVFNRVNDVYGSGINDCTCVFLNEVCLDKDLFLLIKRVVWWEKRERESLLWKYSVWFLTRSLVTCV